MEKLGCAACLKNLKMCNVWMYLGSMFDFDNFQGIIRVLCQCSILKGSKMDPWSIPSLQRWPPFTPQKNQPPSPALEDIFGQLQHHFTRQGVSGKERLPCLDGTVVCDGGNHPPSPMEILWWLNPTRALRNLLGDRSEDEKYLKPPPWTSY